MCWLQACRASKEIPVACKALLGIHQVADGPPSRQTAATTPRLQPSSGEADRPGRRLCTWLSAKRSSWQCGTGAVIQSDCNWIDRTIYTVGLLKERRKRTDLVVGLQEPSVCHECSRTPPPGGLHATFPTRQLPAGTEIASQEVGPSGAFPLLRPPRIRRPLAYRIVRHTVLGQYLLGGDYLQ